LLNAKVILTCESFQEKPIFVKQKAGWEVEYIPWGNS
jgi:hypothetical protein